MTTRQILLLFRTCCSSLTSDNTSGFSLFDWKKLWGLWYWFVLNMEAAISHINVLGSWAVGLVVDVTLSLYSICLLWPPGASCPQRGRWHLLRKLRHCTCTSPALYPSMFNEKDSYGLFVIVQWALDTDATESVSIWHLFDTSMRATDGQTTSQRNGGW